MNSDIDEEVLQEIDQDESLFISDHDTDLGDFSEESDLESEAESELESEPESDVFFVISPLTGYLMSLFHNELLEKLNVFAKEHDFALVTKSSVKT